MISLCRAVPLHVPFLRECVKSILRASKHDDYGLDLWYLSHLQSLTHSQHAQTLSQTGTKRTRASTPFLNHPIRFCGNGTMRRYNEETRFVDKPTDVLSLSPHGDYSTPPGCVPRVPVVNGRKELGMILISPSYVKETNPSLMTEESKNANVFPRGITNISTLHIFCFFSHGHLPRISIRAENTDHVLV